MSDNLTAIAHDLAPTGTLRASINLGNPVLAQGTAASPSGITVDLAREIATQLGLPLDLLCFEAARKSFEAMTAGAADLCFLAIDPAREKSVAFSAPYVAIEGVFAVPATSPISSVADVDRDGVRIGVKQGSAYDLFLTRTFEHATIVRGVDGVDVFAAEGLEVAAGIRQPVTAYVEAHHDLRLVDEPFMQILQAVGTTRTRSAATVAFLIGMIDELKSNGFVAAALERSGQVATIP
ncbi:transporter substrate-binding domain-containing protein [Nocardioides jensenii]|uniref:transporter substrate-binding domain-containing protein n=1 Tax=Nocardioides jensenii TaxID=1843 RepID=UPI00082BEF84|nr:transporter substrate-binding domain-containing protein [Nocardioides jensenii]